MPIFHLEDLVAKIHACFLHEGFSREEAAAIARHLVDAESKAVHSHGVVRIPYYLELARTGQVTMNVTPSVRQADGAINLVDGGGGIGIPTFEFALDFAMDAARRHNCYATAIVNCGHTGRLGAYVERAASNGFMAITMGGGGSGKDWSRVVPFGGARAVMSTNPYALSMPSQKYGPIYADFATSAAAEGKIKVARVKKQKLPPGCIIDREGKPSVDPEDFFAGGALLPAAGPKGSGMAVIAELVGGAMLPYVKEFNWLLVLIKVGAFGQKNYDEAAASFLDRVKSTPATEGHDEVLLPGEVETRSGKVHTENGLNIPDDIWSVIEPELLGA